MNGNEKTYCTSYKPFDQLSIEHGVMNQIMVLMKSIHVDRFASVQGIMKLVSFSKVDEFPLTVNWFSWLNLTSYLYDLILKQVDELQITSFCVQVLHMVKVWLWDSQTNFKKKSSKVWSWPSEVFHTLLDLFKDINPQKRDMKTTKLRPEKTFLV